MKEFKFIRLGLFCSAKSKVGLQDVFQVINMSVRELCKVHSRCHLVWGGAFENQTMLSGRLTLLCSLYAAAALSGPVSYPGIV